MFEVIHTRRKSNLIKVVDSGKFNPPSTGYSTFSHSGIVSFYVLFIDPQTEAPLLIKPYLPDMTKSELHAVMTGGFATIAGSVLAAYISFGVDASHLLSASVMSAPAALAFAKLFYPETKQTRTSFKDIRIEKG